MDFFKFAKDTLAFGGKDIQDARSALTEWVKTGPLTARSYFDPETGNRVLKVAFVQPVSIDFVRAITGALNNTRNSFDQILYATCTVIGKQPRKDIHFPWATDPDDLQNGKLEKGLALYSELWDLLSRQEPYFRGPGYTGGNDIVREVAKIANRKHTIGMQGTLVFGTFCQIPSTAVQPTDPEVRWSPDKSEVEMIVAHDQVHHHHAFSVDIGFVETRFLDGRPAVAVLDIFLDKAQVFLEECERFVTDAGH